MVSKKINKNKVISKVGSLDGGDEVLTVNNFNQNLDKRDFATKSYVGEVLVEQRKEFERYIGALAEDFNDKIKSMGEGISMILERGAEDSEKNRQEHEWFKMKIARLDAKVF